MNTPLAENTFWDSALRDQFNHIKRWNSWRRYNTNAWWYKILVLLGVCRSPTFIYFDDIKDAFNKLCEKYGWSNVDLQLDDDCIEVENKITIKEEDDDSSTTV